MSDKPKHIANNLDFNELAKSYKKDAGSVTRDFAHHVVSLAPSISSASVILDNACGPGVVTEAILKNAGDSPPKIHAVDNAQGMVDLVAKNNWPTVTAAVMDGQNLTFEDGTFTHVISTYGVFMFPDSQKGVEECVRVLKDGGWFGNASWNHLAWVSPAERAWKEIKPDAEPLRWPMPERWHTVEEVRERFEKAGLKNIDTHYETGYTVMESCYKIVDMMRPFLKQILPAVGKLSEEEFDKYCKVMAEEMDKDVEHKDGMVHAKLVSVIASGTK